MKNIRRIHATLLTAIDIPCLNHNDDIDRFYNNIISALILSGSECIPSSTAVASSSPTIPGWNEYVKEHHAIARDAFWWWTANNRPRHGLIYHSMRTSRAQFKYALRFARNQEETVRADAMATDLCNHDVDQFWKKSEK